MESKTFYNESLTEHNVHPYHKHTLEGANMALEGVNPSCGDDIVLLLKVEDDKIVDGAFQGDGCAVSQASADMMLDLIIGKSKDEALRLADIFLRMIQGKASEEELDELEESSILADVAHMYTQGESLESLASLGEWLVHAHTSNPAPDPALGKKRIYPTAADEFDQRSFIEPLKRAGVEQCSIEADVIDFKTDAKNAYEVLKELR